MQQGHELCSQLESSEVKHRTEGSGAKPHLAQPHTFPQGRLNTRSTRDTIHNIMSRSNDAGHYFQTSDALATTARKAAKARNKHGSPLMLPSKVLAVQADPEDARAVYTAEAAGTVRRIVAHVRNSKQVPVSR